MQPASSRDGGTLPQRVRAQARRAAAMFSDRFGRAPTLAAFAPGRVNLIGEHTDYNRGFVLPMAIERETIIVADRSNASISRMWAADLDAALEVDLRQPLKPRRDTPLNYLLGVADQFQRRGLDAGQYAGSLPNLDVVVTSSVPIGAGLSSSAAVEVAFATLLEEAMGARALPPRDKAELCRAAEHAFPGTPCGIMDMYVSAAAREDHALLIDCRNLRAQHVPFDLQTLDATLLVIDTGVKHDLASSEYALRRRMCEEVAAALGVPSLREATIDSLTISGLSDVQRRRALHVIAENTRTVVAAEALVLGDLLRFGGLMFDSHASLRDLYEVSCPELDVLVDAARTLRQSNRGVFGARMTGGGFGGCAIVLCASAAAAEVQEQLRRAFVGRFQREPASMFTTVAAGGAQVIPCAS